MVHLQTRCMAYHCLKVVQRHWREAEVIGKREAESQGKQKPTKCITIESRRRKNSKEEGVIYFVKCCWHLVKWREKQTLTLER